jgi:hypothetical protein
MTEYNSQLLILKAKIDTFGEIIDILTASSDTDLHNNLQNYLNNLKTQMDLLEVPLTKEK